MAESQFRSTPVTFWLVLAATLLAAFLRFFYLSSLTPEAMFDEVWFALRAREWLAAPQFIAFYRTAWGGGNALYVYLTALAQGLGFDLISSSRLPAAALGVLAVPLAYACFSEMLRSEAGWAAQYRRWIAALAAFILAYLLHWIIISRVGTEPSLAPAAALFCVWQLKRGKRFAPQRTQRALSFYKKFSVVSVFSVVNRYLPFILAGLVSGLAQYNGPHARFVLPLLAFIALHDFIRAPAALRRPLALGYGLAALAGLLAVAPLALFFIREPQWLFARAAVTGSGAFNNPKLLLENLYSILISFNFVGSFDPLTNYPGAPMFDPIQSVGFLAGHVWLVGQLRRSAAAREWLAWEGLMIVPSLITGGAPNFQRMIGYAAPAAGIISLGWVAGGRFLTRLWPKPKLQSIAARSLLPAGSGLLGVSLLIHSFTLFALYPQLSILDFAFLAAPVKTARELIRRAEAGERVFVSRHPESEDVIAFEFLFPGAPVTRLDLRQCLPLTDSRTERANYLVLTQRDKQSVVNLYNAYPSANIAVSYFWQEVGSLVEVPAQTPGPRPPNPGRAAFAPGLTFVGYEWSGEKAAAGQSLLLTLWWKAEADLDTDYTSFVHVESEGDGGIVAQRDGQPCQGLFPTSQWRAGDLIRDSFAIPFPPETPPGEYALLVGWYTYPDFQRLPLLAAEAALPDGRARIGMIEVIR